MVDFAKLAAAAKARREEAERGQHQSTREGEATPAADTVGSASPSSPVDVPREAATEAAATPQLVRRFGARKSEGSTDSLEQRVGGDTPASGTDSSGEQSKSRLGSLRVDTGTRDSGGDTSGLVAPSVDSLDALDSSEAQGIAPSDADEGTVSRYSDETPATKPTRELPEGLTKEQLGFIDMVDGVYEVLHEPDMLGGVIRNIMMELKSNPEYIKLVAPDDIRAWVKGMRESMGLAKIKKTEAKAKRSGGAGRKSKLVDDQMLADLDELGIDIPV